ncbi:MAG: hypothetical protein PHP08_00465 [Candidatus Dojkabacteria bacterium]|nr:hypothetical protein [Candidatus Dojkabacteria bacterium]
MFNKRIETEEDYIEYKKYVGKKETLPCDIKREVVKENKINYNNYIDYMECMGRIMTHKTLTEKDAVIRDCHIGITSCVVDFYCPPGEIYSIMGTQDVLMGDDQRTAYPLGIELCNTEGFEVHPLTKIRITKATAYDDIVQLDSLRYFDVSINENGKSKDVSRWYRFNEIVELCGEYHLFIFVVGETREEGIILPDIEIDSNHIKFSLEIDRWKK